MFPPVSILKLPSPKFEHCRSTQEIAVSSPLFLVNRRLRLLRVGGPNEKDATAACAGEEALTQVREIGSLRPISR